MEKQCPFFKTPCIKTECVMYSTRRNYCALVLTKTDGVKTRDPNIPTDTQFERFWAAYPTKKNKGDALRVWRKLAPTKELFAQIMMGLSRATASAEWDTDSGQFIPYPAKWLRARGWEDEYETTSGMEKARQMYGKGE